MNFNQKLIEKLNMSGFGLAEGIEVTESRDIERIAGNLSERDSDHMSEYRMSCFELSERLGLCENDVPVLIAIASEGPHPVSVVDLKRKYPLPHRMVDEAVTRLLGKLFIEIVNGRVAKVLITVRGLMCLIAECRMEDLDVSQFDKVDPDRSLSPAAEDDSHEEFRGFLNENDSEEDDQEDQEGLGLGRNGECGFVECLSQIYEMLDDSSFSSNDFDTVMERNLKRKENRRFKKALHSMGWEKMPSHKRQFLLLAAYYFVQHGPDPMNFGRKDSVISCGKERMALLSKAANGLILDGIVVVPPDDAGSSKDDLVKERYMLSPDAVGKLFHGMTELVNYSTLCKQADVVKSSNIEKKTLFFDPQMQEKVDCLMSLMNPAVSKSLMDRLSDVGRKALTCLFYGAPGVGKTELAKQLALSTGRDIIVADPAKLSGSYWGDSEKNIREIFRAYKYLQKISDNAPILAFNEAEGILAKRFTDVSRSIEKSDNAVQGIILQELEDMEGIFIAMTNLECNIDPAADRRFLYKLRFDNPSGEVRARILHSKMKWMSEEDALSIASEFNLSGGQIDNIASKCVIERFITGNEAGLDKIRSFCREEISMRRNGASRNSIGFVWYQDRASR